MLVDGLTHSYGAVKALDGVGFAAEPGQRIAVIGPSGCGKSTLLEIVAGLIAQSAGTVTIYGSSSSEVRLRHCALMPQRDLLLPWRDALGNASLAVENRGVDRRQARAEVLPEFERLGLDGFAQAKPWQLSGGMRQRVAFIRTLAAKKDVLLLDEPFGSLDAITRAQMQEWLKAVLATCNSTTLLVTHDVEEALLLCQRVIVLTPRPGRVSASIEVDLPEADGRRELIGKPEFVALKDRVLLALEDQ